MDVLCAHLRLTLDVCDHGAGILIVRALEDPELSTWVGGSKLSPWQSLLSIGRRVKLASKSSAAGPSHELSLVSRRACEHLIEATDPLLDRLEDGGNPAADLRWIIGRSARTCAELPLVRRNTRGIVLLELACSRLRELVGSDLLGTESARVGLKRLLDQTLEEAPTGAYEHILTTDASAAAGEYLPGAPSAGGGADLAAEAVDPISSDPISSDPLNSDQINSDPINSHRANQSETKDPTVAAVARVSSVEDQALQVDSAGPHVVPIATQPPQPLQPPPQPLPQPPAQPPKVRPVIHVGPGMMPTCTSSRRLGGRGAARTRPPSKLTTSRAIPSKSDADKRTAGTKATDRPAGQTTPNVCLLGGSEGAVVQCALPQCMRQNNAPLDPNSLGRTPPAKKPVGRRPALKQIAGQSTLTAFFATRRVEW